jgi:hypothetical protein
MMMRTNTPHFTMAGPRRALRASCSIRVRSTRGPATQQARVRAPENLFTSAALAAWVAGSGAGHGEGRV